jgi:GNAT superfamily N-acetyltransferase
MAGVHEEYRGRGLQKRLIRARVRHAKRIGWKYAITYTIDNPPSENSLIGCGFKRYAPADPYVKGTANYWRKLL